MDWIIYFWLRRLWPYLCFTFLCLFLGLSLAMLRSGGSSSWCLFSYSVEHWWNAHNYWMHRLYDLATLYTSSPWGLFLWFLFTSIHFSVDNVFPFLLFFFWFSDSSLWQLTAKEGFASYGHSTSSRSHHWSSHWIGHWHRLKVYVFYIDFLDTFEACYDFGAYLLSSTSVAGCVFFLLEVLSSFVGGRAFFL